MGEQAAALQEGIDFPFIISHISFVIQASRSLTRREFQ
jgi:hypothetical protein